MLASTGERLQIQIIISREVCLHRDHNKSIALYNYFIIYYNVIIIEIKYARNVMHLNHPETQSMEELSSTIPVPGAKKVGDCWYVIM